MVEIIRSVMANNDIQLTRASSPRARPEQRFGGHSLRSCWKGWCRSPRDARWNSTFKKLSGMSSTCTRLQEPVHNRLYSDACRTSQRRLVRVGQPRRGSHHRGQVRDISPSFILGRKLHIRDPPKADMLTVVWKIRYCKGDGRSLG